MPSKLGNLGTKKILIAVIVAIVVIAAIIGGLIYNANRVILKENVVVYNEETSPFTILESDEESITVSSTEGLKPGMVLGAGVTDATPNGLLRKLGSPQEKNGVYVIPTTQAALTDAIEQCNVRTEVTFTSNEEGTVDETETASESSLIEQAHGADGLDNLFSKSVGFGSVSAGNRVAVNLEVRKGMNVHLRVTDRFACEAMLDGGSADVTLFENSLKPFNLQVGPLPVVITPELEIGAHAEASLQEIQLEAGTSIDRTLGFEYTTEDGLWVINEDNSKEPYANFSVDDNKCGFRLSGGIEASLAVYLYGIVGVDVSAGLDGTLRAKLEKVPDGEPTDGAVTIPGSDINFNGYFTGKLTLPISGRFVLRVPMNPFDLSNNLKEVTDIELFDTDDSIVLWETDMRFGKIDETYEVDLGHGLPKFEFDYPTDWEVGELKFTYPQSEEYFMGYAASASGGGLEIKHGEDCSVNLHFYAGVPGGAVGARYKTEIGEAAPAELEPKEPLSEAFIIAEIEHEQTSADPFAKSNAGVGNATRFYALVPQSYVGTDEDANWRTENSAIFPYGSWPSFPSHSFLISFTSSSINNMSETEKEQVIDMLASLRVIG